MMESLPVGGADTTRVDTAQLNRYTGFTRTANKTKEKKMPKYKITAIVNTDALDLGAEIDDNDPVAVENWLQYDSGDTPIDEAFSNIKAERIEG